MAVRKRFLIFISIIGLVRLARAQDVLNSFENTSIDSLLEARTREREENAAKKGSYGAKSTRFTYEKNFKFNDIIFTNPDTIPDDLHRFSDLERDNYLIQNLGNPGTAYRHLFFEPSRVIGRTSGYHVYDRFHTTPDQIRYYDTRSPFTDIYAAFGGGGRARTEVVFTFNDSIHFNIGFNLNSIRADKQLAYLARGDRNVKSNDWNIFGFLRPQKLPHYLLLFNTTQFDHEVEEQGGIINPSLDPDPNASFFAYRDANVILKKAFSTDKRGGLHLYQQYDLDSIFQVYHAFTFQEQITRFLDRYDLTTSDSLLYKPVADETKGEISQRTTFTAWDNELGLKGRTKKFSYTLYYKNRLLKYDIARIQGNTRETEHSMGGTLRQQITPKIFLKASGEYLLGGNYFLEGQFTSDFFDATYSRMNNKPTFLSERFEGHQRQWTNLLKSQVSDNLKGTIKLNFGMLSLKPFVRFNRIANYTFFNRDLMPAQAARDMLILITGTHLDWQLSKRWLWRNSVYYNSVSGGALGLFRIPRGMALSQLAYKNQLFNGRMIIQTGVDVHFRSSYFAHAYDPTAQQFYLQNDFKNDGFAKVDLFLNFKVKNFLLFLKSNHFNQGLTGAEGYFITPYFTGTRRTTDIGVRWSFYD